MSGSGREEDAVLAGAEPGVQGATPPGGALRGDAPPQEMQEKALDLPHAAASGRLVLSHRNTFAVTTSRGEVTPPGARELGVFHDDTRYLSRWELELPRPPTLLSSGTEGCLTSQVDLTTTDTEEGGLLDEPVQYLHVARRQVLDGAFQEEIVVTNHLGRPVCFDVAVRFGADWADVFEVRGARREARGRVLAPRVGGAHVVLGYLGRDRQTYRSRLDFHPAPRTLEAGGAEGIARYTLALAAGTHATLGARLTMTREEEAPAEATDRSDEMAEACATTPAALPTLPRANVQGFELVLSRARCAAATFRGRCAEVRCDDAGAERAFARALADVHALRVVHGDRTVVGAGIPWFAAPFGRDALLASLQLLPFAPDLARETLSFLGALQGTVDDAVREEEPGKILHELRRGELVRTGEIPHAPYFGSVDATPLYVILAAEAWTWSGNRRLLDAVWSHVVAAMGWLDARTGDGTRFLTYQRRSPRGLENQGWKDSRDGVSFPDGRRAQGPIALVEVQGYAAAAWRGAAMLARARGDDARAAAWEARVAPFVGMLDDAFWMPRAGFHALALDGSGRQVETLTSNPGHLLWCRAISDARAERVRNRLVGPELWSGWGIRTVGRGQTVYNPLSYHNGSVWPHDTALCALGFTRYGHGREAVAVTEGLLAASQHFALSRLPELFCGLDRGDGNFVVHYPVSCSPQAWASGALYMLLQACLGLSADAASGGLTIVDPALPTGIRRLDLLGVQVGEARVSLRFTRQGMRTFAEVLEVAGGALKVVIEVRG